MKKLFAFLVLCSLAWTAAARSISFYVVAHPDDWQLFMTPNSFNDLRGDAGDRIVFIYLTSGDDGAGWNLQPQDYPFASRPRAEARERAAVASSRFVTLMQGGKAGLPISPRTTTIANRSVTVYEFRNTIHYFLRLPDKVRDTQNFTDTDLDKIVSGNQGLTTIDGSSTYNSRWELSDFVAQIFIKERTGNPAVHYDYCYLNRPEKLNAGYYDHGDHKNAGEIAQEAADYLDMEVYAFQGYSTAQLCPNLVFSPYYNYNNPYGPPCPPAADLDGFENETSLLAIIANSLMGDNYDNPFEPAFHKTFLGRNYFRLITYHSRAAGPSPAAGEPTRLGSAELEVYPVPTGRQLTVQVPAGVQGPATLVLADARGRKLREVSLSPLKQTAAGVYAVDVADVPAGLYFVTLTAGGKTFQRKIVKANQ